MRKLNEQTSPFEPVPAEVFEIEGIPGKTFLALVVGKRRNESRRFCNNCFMNSQGLCRELKVVCSPTERQDGRQIIVREKQETMWSI